MGDDPRVKRICLAVDDEPSIRSHFRSLLEKEGFETLEAENAAEALRVVHRMAGSLDLIITDVRMPGDMDGLDLAHSVRLSFPEIPIILISAYGEPHDGKASDFEFVHKPFRPEELSEVIRRATAQRSRASTPE